MFGIETTTELGAATAVLEKYGKVDETIAAEVDALQPVIAELLTAQAELKRSETSAALDEQPATPPAKAAKRLEAAKVALDVAGLRLTGLRSRALSLVVEMPAARAALLPTLPEHDAEVRSDFEGEWVKACTEFAQVLGRRAAIEAAIGERMDLSEPQPVAVEIDPVIGRPHKCAGELLCIVQTGAQRHTPERAEKPVDRHEVFVLKRPTRGLEANALVVSATFPAGKLEGLITFESVHPWRDPAEHEAQRAIKRAQKEALDAKRLRQDEASEAVRKAESAERDKRIRDQFGEDAIYKGPTGQAALPEYRYPENDPRFRPAGARAGQGLLPEPETPVS